MLLNCLSVGIGGFVGAVLRYLASFLFKGAGSFPWGTFFINLTGTFILAFFSTLFLEKGAIDSRFSLFLRVGLCGGFTTFSTFGFESLSLLQQGNYLLVLLYISGSCFACLLAAFAGVLFARMFLN